MQTTNHNITALLDKDPGLLHFKTMLAWAAERDVDTLEFTVKADECHVQARAHIQGQMVSLERFDWAKSLVEGSLKAIWAATQVAPYPEYHAHVDFSFDVVQGGKPVTLLASWFQIQYTSDYLVTFRFKGGSRATRSLKDLGFLEHQVATLQRALANPWGLNLFSSPVRNGRHATVQSVNHQLLGGKAQAMTPALRAPAGTSPVIIDEIRDFQDAQFAMGVVDDGGPVLASLYTRNAMSAVGRLASGAIGLSRERLAVEGVLNLSVWQVLLPSNCPHCSKSPDDYARALQLTGHNLDEHEQFFANLHRLYGIEPGQFRLRDPHGCHHCADPDLVALNGFAGRTAVAEIVEFDNTMREFILRKQDAALNEYWKAKASSSWLDNDLTGKSALHCAVLKSSMGLIDPRELPHRFPQFGRSPSELPAAAAPVV